VKMTAARRHDIGAGVGSRSCQFIANSFWISLRYEG
jgi:hypothetical protein